MAFIIIYLLFICLFIIFGWARASLLRGGSPLVVASRGYSAFVENRFLTVVACLVAEHGL